MDNKKNDDVSQVVKLRTAMFDQIERLNDPKLDLDKELKRANAITSVGNVIVNSIKVQIDAERLKHQVNLPTSKRLGNGK